MKNLAKNSCILSLLLLLSVLTCYSQDYIFKASNVFDGTSLHQNWVVAVTGNKISYAGPEKKFKKGTVIELEGKTLMPGMIEGHGHMFLYPYNQTSWNDQVLKESIAYRTIRATKHAKATLLAGFTTVRDLGTEGAEYADVGLKNAIEDGTIIGPRLLISTKAIVATGSYGPKGFADHVRVPLGAEQADGVDNLTKVVRNQIGQGADFIKVYADYRYGPNKEAMPTFTLDELSLIVNLAESSGRYVVAHASTPEGMRRAVLAGVETIEHGDGGTPEIWKLMKEHNVALCPTLAAGDAILQYNGWNKGTDPDPDRIIQKKESFKQALAHGVTIVAGGDVGVFEHGDNARELLMMEEYGMSRMQVLQTVTSVNADYFHLGEQVGRVKEGLFADLIVVDGNPSLDLSILSNPTQVMKNGVLYK